MVAALLFGSCIAGCFFDDADLTTSSSARDSSMPPTSTDAARPTSSFTTDVMHEEAETGLCQRWSQVTIDPQRLTSRTMTQGSLLVNGLQGGFSVVALGQGTVEALWIDSHGAVRTDIELPIETDATLNAAIGTPDGGFLVRWTHASAGAGGSGSYFVRYDASGIPVARTNEIESTGGAPSAVIAANADGDDVAYTRDASAAGWESRWGLGVVSLDGSEMSEHAAIAALNNDTPVSFFDGTLLTMATATDTNARQATIARLWDRHGTRTASLFFDSHGGGISIASHHDAVVEARWDGVWFERAESETLVPADIVLNDARALPGPTSARDTATIAFLNDLPSASGGANVLQVVDVSSSGARGVVGEAPIDATVMGRAVPFDYTHLGLGAASSFERDAVLVVARTGTPGTAGLTAAATFRCEERAP
jgi:hypothetical protein